MNNQPTVIRPFSAAKLSQAMASCGKPGNDKEVRQVYRAAIAAGCTHGVAFCLALVAYNTMQGYEGQVMEEATHLRTAMRYDHRDRYPNGKWAHVFDHHGHGAAYLDEHHPDLRNWTQLPRSVRPVEAGDL